MASIKKISISGLRCFHDGDIQNLEFCSPLTIIVGGNGCGKTTIVESLKYAATGSLPPLSESGTDCVRYREGAVVHASVEIRFTAADGKEIVVKRNMSNEMSGGRKAVFTQETGSLTVSDPNTGEDKIEDLTGSELDERVPVLLGAPKETLDHVMLCHQTEESWPLDDTSGELKKNLGAIFGTDKFAEAAEAGRAVRKDLLAKAEELEKHTELNERITSLEDEIALMENEGVSERSIQRLRNLVDFLKREQPFTPVRDIKKKIAVKKELANCFDHWGEGLDKTIRKVHCEKIALVNQIVQQLWNVAFQDGGIGCIEIVIDEYGYRVEMIQRARKISMPGFASRDQQVLASIIIRLALAVSFGCGFLALDEPASGLDFNSQIRLAAVLAHALALCDLQLILLTHDEDFVEIVRDTVANSLLPEKYFRLETIKGEFPCVSKIKAVDWW